MRAVATIALAACVYRWSESYWLAFSAEEFASSISKSNCFASLLYYEVTNITPEIVR